ERLEIRTPDGHASSNHGATWTDTGVGGLRAAQSPANPNRWYFSLYKGDVWTSSDDANSSAYAGTLPSNLAPAVLAPSHADANLVYALGASTAQYVGQTGGVYRSSNAGVTSEWASDGLVRVEGLADLVVDPTNDRLLYAGGRDGVHKSTDGGA